MSNSSVKKPPANPIKISAVILNLAGDKPDSDENRKIRAGRRVYNVNLKKKFKGPEVLATP